VFRLRKSDLRIVGEDLKKRRAVKTVTAGHDEHFELWRFRRDDREGGHEQQELLHII